MVAERTQQKFTVLLPTHPLASTVAPTIVSTAFPTIADKLANKISDDWIMPNAAAMEGNTNAVMIPTAEPNRDTAPLVPGGTVRNDRMNRGARPRIIPSSCESVSESAAVRFAMITAPSIRCQDGHTSIAISAAEIVAIPAFATAFCQLRGDTLLSPPFAFLLAMDEIVPMTGTRKKMNAPDKSRAQ